MGPGRVIRWHVAGLVVLLGTVSPARSASAEGVAVRIDSEPEGARVFIEDGADGRVEVTPYTGKLKPGKYTLIFELEGYRDQIQEISVRKRRGVQSFSVALEQLDLGVVKFEITQGGEGAGDALVLIDGDERGTLADPIKVAAGAHLLQVKKDGFELYEEWIEVEGNKDLVVRIALQASAGGAAADTAGAADVEVSDEAPARGDEGGAVVTAAVGLELGGRVFRSDTMVRTYDAAGIVFLRVLAEVYPLARSQSKYLAGLGVTGTFARAAPFSSDPNDPTEDPVDTSWGDYSIGLRYRIPAAERMWVGAVAAYGRQHCEFDDGDGDPTMGIDAVAAGVDYRFYRLGRDAAWSLGSRSRAWLGGEYQLVNDIGLIAQRFAGTSVFGLGARAGLAVELTQTFDVRLLTAYNVYRLEFDEGGGEVLPGRDHFFSLMLGGAYRF